MITRKQCGFGGQAVALRISGHVDSDKDGLYYTYTDHLGSVRAMSDVNGNLEANTTARYLPFGDWLTEPTSELTDHGFTGHEHNNTGNSDIGLVYMNARYYVPGAGRFGPEQAQI